MAGQLTIDTLKASSGVLATQNGMTGICKAWLQYNGTTAAVSGSFNVSSVTRNSTGSFTVYFTTAFANANYSAVATGGLDGGEIVATTSRQATPPTTTYVLVETRRNNADTNPYYLSLAVFGN